MLTRRAFLKLTALSGLAAFAPRRALVAPLRRIFRILLPSDVRPEQLAALAADAGLSIQAAYYTDTPALLLQSLKFDLVAVPAQMIPALIRGARITRLPALDLSPLGGNWAAGRRPHDPENAYSLPRDWGYVSVAGYRRSNTFTPRSPRLWADDWAIPSSAPAPALSAEFLSRWLVSPQASALAASAPPPRADLPWPIRFAARGEFRLPRPQEMASKDRRE